MDKPAHTPGPWHVGNADVYADGSKSSDYDDIVICAIGQSGGFRSHEYAVVKAHKPEGRANARLIAAAPELLAALQALFSSYKDLADSGDAGYWSLEDQPEGKQALAAIAKALGQETTP